MNNLIISDCREQNLERIYELEINNSYNPWTKKMFMDEFANKSSFLKIANFQNNIIGFIIYRINIDEAEIMNLVIDAHCRNNGFGEKLLLYAVEDIKLLCANKIFLEVRDSNKAAIKLYTKNGFKKYNIRKNYYTVEDALLMKKIL